MIDRRILLLGTVLAPLAAPPSAPAVAGTSVDIARRVHRLAGEISRLLSDLDAGMWELRVSPAFNSAPMFSVEPIANSDEARLNRGLTVALGALNRMRPGHWRREVHLRPNYGFVLLVDDGPRQAGEGA
jgi:hypothetical protein